MVKKRMVNGRSVITFFSTAISVGGLLASSILPAEAQQTTPVATPVISADAQAVSQQVAAGPSATAENRLVLSLRSRRVYLYQGDMLLSSYPVAIGTAETPTPQGEFTVSKMVENPVWQSPWTGEIHEPGPNSALGLRWIEFASTEAGSFGFHGTPTVESIGKAASNGCVRMYNEDVVALFARVSVGTPVSVWP
ncbi:MAG: L,D-transpeptidase family protein [Cyanobacteria bacterium P01_D01_bin.36]